MHDLLRDRQPRRSPHRLGNGRGIAGVIDGSPPAGVETEADVATRHGLLRQIGYKL